MSSTTNRPEDLNLVDPELAAKPHLRAILYPKSTSAQYSVSLDESHYVLPSIVKPRLLSPDPSSSNDEDSTEPSETNSSRASRQLSRLRRSLTQSQSVILLDQSEANEKFTLGSATANNVVLKHPNSADDNVCYINITHGEFCPDPDNGSIVLYNSSASLFYAQSITGPYVKRTIAKDEEATLECGRWKVVLGKGMDFEIEVLPWAPTEIQGDLELISPTPVRTYPSLNGTSPTPTGTIGPALHSNETVKSRHATKAIRFAMPTSSASTTVDPPDIQRYSICDQICRRPTVSGSASAWRNEMEILNRLNHVSLSWNLVEFPTRTTEVTDTSAVATWGACIIPPSNPKQNGDTLADADCLKAQGQIRFARHHDSTKCKGSEVLSQTLEGIDFESGGFISIDNFVGGQVTVCSALHA
ncbi:hypothetical protein DL95DRAFT_497732 [Leptodontidium sp. 2 PMI_412]|nr:hypothetical protein DL95DRAFT_497732 [Leptodontidium sp. 2 PMI_412]